MNPSRIPMAKPAKIKFKVREVFANGDERCELRWPLHGNLRLGSHVKDWKEVRGVDFEIDTTTSEAVLTFTRSTANSGRLRRPS
jgi:hypothetical protein